MPLVSLRNLRKAHAGRLLFNDIAFSLDDRERVGLIGPNGAGKSTLLQIVAGLQKPDSGDVIVNKGVRVVYVPQAEEFDATSVEDVLHHALRHDTADESEKNVRVEIALADSGLDNFRDTDANRLSGGWKKRLALVAGIVQEPDLLLLDEPTNHLDMEGVLWLEETLLQHNASGLLFVSHDRAFLNNIAARVIELSGQYPDGYLSSVGNYADFITVRETFLAQQAHREVALSSEARREIAWLRRGARARTTKAKGRIEDAHELFESLSEVKTRNRDNRNASIAFSASDRGTKELVTLIGVSKAYGDTVLFRDLDMGIERRNRLAIIGANGSGKTTLLKMIVGDETPDSGKVKQARNLEIAYFDQARQEIDPTQKLRDALSPNSDIVRWGEQSLHIVGWAKRFGFRADQLDLPVSALSGGERARIGIAGLMLQKADLLILDEPTNDLDIPTLDILESSLREFSGAVILVSHDRYLMDAVATQFLALHGEGDYDFVASTEQWEVLREARRIAEAAKQKAAFAASKKSAETSVARTVPPFISTPRPTVKTVPQAALIPLTTAERRELKEIEAKIEVAEAVILRIETAMNDAQNVTDAAVLARLWEELPIAKNTVESLFARWEELDARKAAVR